MNWLQRLIPCLALTVASTTSATAVAVHDPSVVIVYKDGSGNSYPDNDAAKTRTKFFYVFGTQLGAAYSKDMIDWTAFKPSFADNGTVTTDYTKAFAIGATWAGYNASADVLGNLWAPDILYNKVLKKWCLYFSVNGDLWRSSIVMHTADKIEGPYTYAGAVVYSGMTNGTTGTGNDDYKKVTGTSTVAARYLDASGKWTGTYGTSTIDPAVTYDEAGRLWMVYGSWSGGIFLIKLDEKTGLRDLTWNYGYGTAPVSNGTTLRYDPYMGLHLGGGYYVSGEGSYIRYLKDPSGVGFYYLFVSMGFYSPEGGYTMRVFRSATIDGTYTDVTGDNAAFAKYVLNYGNNVTYGFPIMQNYKWSWWTKGEIAQGHNSVLRDEDGQGYLVYHRKFDDGTIIHNVETHKLVFNKQGWILAAPFEHRVGQGVPTRTLGIDEIVGDYGVITHNSVDYANLASNIEVAMSLKADGTVSGAYTGTWTYEFASGRQYLTLTTSAGTFNGVLLEQLLNDRSDLTLSFTAMNPANEKALWGYRKPKTSWRVVKDLSAKPTTIGASDFSLLWSDSAKFLPLSVSGDFATEFVFKESSRGQENWDNWALVFANGTQRWRLRGDAYSNSTMSGTTVTHKTDWNGSIDFKTAYAGKTVRLLARKSGTTIDVFAFANDILVATATATGCPSGNYTVSLGGEAVSLEVAKSTTAKILDRERVGTVSDYGTYPVAFNSVHSTTRTVTGDFRIRYRFANHRTASSADYWDNYLVRLTHDGASSFLRADAYAADMTGTMAYTYDWTWEKFLALMNGADVDMTIGRAGSTMQFDTRITARDGTKYSYVATNTGGTTSPIVFDLTTEDAMVDLLEADTLAGTATIPVGTTRPVTASGLRATARDGMLVLESSSPGAIPLRTMDGRVVSTLRYSAGSTSFRDLRPGLYLVGRETVVIH